MTTIGVEEEFLLIDPATGENAPVAEKVLAALDHRAHREFRTCMVEMVTDVCDGLDDLREQLVTGRRAAAGAAAGAGAALLPVGATPVAERSREPADDPRFRAIVDHYGPIARDPAVCGCHVHVGVPDRALAAEICSRVRGWLPVIQALAANSPLFEGADTGYASWRSVQLLRWPTVGPWPDDRDRLVPALVAAGEMLDETMAFWYARPSASFPTVEVRVADVCLTAEDTVLVAALVRGLVTAAAADDPPLSDPLLRAAHGSAARRGLDGDLLDARTGRARPAWDLVGELVDRVTPALRRHGDLGAVLAGLDRVRREGTGAARQRRLLAGHGSLPEVLRRLSVPQ